MTLPREDSPNSARARNSPASLLESSPNSSAAIPDPNHQPSRKAALPLPGPAESPLPRTVHPDSSASSAASAPSDHFADPSSASISRVSVLIKRPLGFDATAYPRLSDIILAPSTFPDSSFPFSVPAPASQDNPTDTAQLSIVIPDSQGFDDSASFSTFLSSPLKHHEASPAKHDIGVSFLDEAFGYNESQLQPTEISPPPSYEESTTQSTTNSGASQVQVSEVAVQTSPPALDSVEPEDQEIEKDLGEESFDLDLPQNLDLSYRLEDLSFNPPPRENESAQDPGQQDTPIVDISNRDSVKEPVEETRQNEQLSIGISGEISAKTTQKPEEFENTTGPLFHNNNQAQDSERRVSKKRTRRKRLSGDRLEDWFRVNKRPRFVPEPLSSQEFPLPPDTISAYTDPSFPRPPSLSSSMSQASSASPRPLSLKEKVEAHLRHMEEQLEQRKRRSSIARSSPASTTREILSPFRPSPAPPLFESQQEPDAQLPAHSIPPPVQSFTATEGSTTAPNPTKSTQDSSLGHIPNSMVQSQFGPAVFEEEEYAIALPLSTATVPSDGLNQKSVYMHEIYEKQADIEEYLAKRDKPESRGNKIAFNLVRTIGQIATHPNLVYPVEPWPSDEQEAQYQAVMSAKFHFLHELFDLIKDENVKIAVVAEAPQLIVCASSLDLVVCC